MANLNGFDAATEQLSNCIPANDYDLVITKCDLKPGAKFQQLAMEFKVLNGEFQNRVVFGHYMFSLNKPDGAADGDKKAVAIGRGKFGAICKAVGIPKPAETTELVGKPFTAKLKIRKSDEYGDQNEIVSAKPRGPASASAPTAPGGSEPKW